MRYYTVDTVAVFQDERQFEDEGNALKGIFRICVPCITVESLMEAFPTCGQRDSAVCVMFAYLIWYLFVWGVMLF